MESLAHRATMTGLDPTLPVRYRVGSDKGWSPVRVLAPAGSGAFRFCSFGDHGRTQFSRANVAQVAARNMLAGTGGDRARFDAVPFFWSQHYDVVISYVGHAARWDELAIDGDIGAKDCTVTYRLDGRTLAVATIFRDRASLEAELALERNAASEAVR